MSMQLPLPGFETVSPVDWHRLFFAVFPGAEAVGRIARLADRLRFEHGLRGEPLHRDRFHVSLCPLGDFLRLPSSLVAWACEVAAGIVAAPFEVELDRAMSFRGRESDRPLVLVGCEGVVALSAFQRTLATAMRRAGWVVRRTAPAFAPHLTLLYDPRAVPELSVESIRWTVCELVLVHSLVGRTRYTILGRWRLGG